MDPVDIQVRAAIAAALITRHDRIVRRRFVIPASVMATMAADALITYTLFSW